jgi:hypothetical protein
MADDPTGGKHARLDSLADALYTVLPAEHRRDIALRLGVVMRERFTLKNIDTLIYKVRKRSEYYGWTVQYAPHSKNESGKRNRFIVATTHRDDTYLTDSEKHSCLEGRLTALQSTATMAGQQAEMLRAQAMHEPDSRLARKIREEAKILTFAGERIEAIIEELRDRA